MQWQLLQSLTDGDNTREHTYSRNERKTEEKKKKRRGGGRGREEKEVAHELQGERMEEERKRERERKIRECVKERESVSL